MSDISIVKANLEHLETVANLFNAYRVFYKKDPDIVGARSFIEARMEKDESVIFLALEDNEGLGFAQLFPTFDSVALKKYWILSDIFVKQKARRRGIGQELLNTARDFARASGARTLQLEAAYDNKPAQSLYEKMGWKRAQDYYFYHFHFD